jgi:hypothetical protein
MILAPLGIALIVGTYAYFVNDGADNVFRMPPGDLRLQFQISAVLLTLLEAVACWLALRMLRIQSTSKACTGMTLRLPHAPGKRCCERRSERTLRQRHAQT